ncbi:hypothetical protein [Flavobacterium sp. N502536]|uniref:hypothetical protein n=1 Tax=Flavobacterium sp. N502536 TaxID=2986837 RepID=UPI002222D503|nr:hypothetical protein [Flavobacterium sp. N502536]
MNDSDPKYSIHISFRQPLEGLQLVLVDGTLNKIVEEETQKLELSLLKGIYQLKASFIDYFEEYFLTVSQDEHFVLDYHYPMTSPSMEFATTHEYFSNPAETWSRKCTSSDNNKIPNFFFFAAAYDRDFPNKEQTVIELLTSFSLFDPNGKLYIRFRDKNSFIDPDASVLVFSARLKKGMYFLQYEKEKERRIFPFYIYDRFQTQFLLRYKQTPDFSNSFFYYDNKFGFNRTDDKYLLLDKIQYVYKDYSNYKLLTPSDRSAIKAHPYLVALLHVLHLVTENEQDSLEFANVPILYLPDIALLTALKDSKQQINSDQLPIVSAIMAKCMVTAGKKMEFRPGSIMDRVLDSLSFDIFWNNFSAVEDLLIMEKLYNELLDKSKIFSKNIKRKATQILANSIAPELLKEERLNTLLGNNPIDTPESDLKFIEAIKSVGDVSKISNKLNLPPTTILRNYEKYDDIYKKMNLK